MSEINIINHPLVQDKLTLMRNKNTDSGMFRTLLSEISLLLGYEATRNWPTYEHEIETALNIKASFPMIRSGELVFVSVLRAGNGMLDGLLKLIPSAHVGHLGLYRDPKAQTIIEYYFKLPPQMSDKHVMILDPLIATGNSAVAAVNRVKEYNPKSITFISVVAAPEGISYFQDEHPEVKLYTAAVDIELDSRNYIVPGVGDAGDRMFGTA